MAQLVKYTLYLHPITGYEVANWLLGIKPKDAMRYLRRQSNIPFLPCDIYNLYATFKRK
jgi:hypothetical protein